MKVFFYIKVIDVEFFLLSGHIGDSQVLEVSQHGWIEHGWSRSMCVCTASNCGEV